MKRTISSYKLWLFLLFTQCIIAQTNVLSEKDTHYSEIEIMAEFPNGLEGLRNYNKENFKYPPLALKNSCIGKALINFSVDSTGKALYESTNFQNMKFSKKRIPDSEKLLTIEELEISFKVLIENMPLWTPGKQIAKSNQNKNDNLLIHFVKCKFTLPINFN